MAIDLRGKLKTQEQLMASIYGDKSCGQIEELPLSDLKPYKTQPFKPYHKDKLEELAEYIKQNGLMSPIIVREMHANEEFPFEYYQILSGHNRVNASRLAELDTIQSIIKKDITDEEALLIMVNTNLNQRDKLLPSEKAFAYKMQMDAYEILGTNGPSVSKVAEEHNTNRKEIYRYIRLTYLIEDLLNMVDEEELPFRAGVAFSYLSESEQEICSEYMLAHEMVFKVDEAESIKRYSQELADNEITEETLDRLFSKPTKEQKEKPIKISLSLSYADKYFSGKSSKEIEEELLEILDNHFKANNL